MKLPMLPKAQPPRGVVGSFAYVDEMLAAARQAKESGFTVRDIYTPVPVEEAVEVVSPGPSPVRYFTGAGAITGLVGGFALAIMTSLIWNLIVGGKPVAHHIPFVVVGFELLILCGAIFTLLALFYFARVPFLKFPTRAYRPEFSKDRFGVWLDCPDAERAKAADYLRTAGAELTEDVTGEEGGER